MTRDLSIDALRDSGTRLEEDFLSIDVDALIRKITGQTFRSPHHYPVELVRSALTRGARRVDVTVNRATITVRDDGRGVDTKRLDELVRVFDRALPPHRRQEALVSFETPTGIDLLAALAPSPSRVSLRTRTVKGEGTTLVVDGGKARMGRLADAPAGTRIRIHRKGDAAAEVEALTDWCRFARGEVTVNGRRVSTDRPPRTALMGSPLEDDGALVWIPARGDVCRVMLLDHGVRFHETMRPATYGLVFEAAVETHPDGEKQAWDRALEQARSLYAALATGHASSPPGVRARIEELAFLHHRRTGSATLVDAIAPFATLSGGSSLTLTRVREGVSRGELRALEVDDDPSLYQTRGVEVLVLTARQWEFLVEHARVPLSHPPPLPRHRSLIHRLGDAMARSLTRMADGMHAALMSPVDPATLSPPMHTLVDRLAEEIEAGRIRFPDLDVDGPPRVVASLRVGGRPGRLLQLDGEWMVAVNTRHPLTRRAAGTLARDSRTIALAAALLTGGRGISRP